MITATFVRSAEDNRIVSFAISGHADYAKRGKDIICAGVSTVSVGTVNAIEELTGVELPASMRSGWLQSEIPLQADDTVNERIQLLLESMRVMLASIAVSYGKYVEVRELIDT
ncbi:ribosomal-processing cysteine protease Prp [Paenibacillus methanolicus]|uniref:Ribosomal processing cysteine protease Prp n=1 Tax=Paenibacillus methanolicus TaxID=582686 RepID=A0A5S5C343_9BACL|nr:ribosomal-processing cysteine protease Prp [Paenibacillus methanolicus]TYP73845.1 hypothetical protein BCM02_106121 [Paenibacillus methanolicus]